MDTSTYQNHKTNNPNPPPYYEEDEITLKELILKLQEFWREVWIYKIWVILAGCLLAGLFFLKTQFEETTYTSSLTFLVSDNNNKGAGELSTILGYGTYNYELDKIVELARSKRIINDVLLREVNINGIDNYLANHLIDIYNFQETWTKEAESNLFPELQLKNFYFVHDTIRLFSTRARRGLNILNELVAGNNFNGKVGMMNASYDKKTEMVQLSVRTKNEDLSTQLINNVFEELRDFYEEETVGRPKRALASLRIREDSISRKLKKQEIDLARETDQYAGLVSNIHRLKLGQSQRKVETTNRVYQEILKSKERLELLLNSETPEFQIIDRTFLPIKETPSMLKALLIGGFLGGFLSIGWIIGRKIIRDALAT